MAASNPGAVNEPAPINVIIQYATPQTATIAAHNQNSSLTDRSARLSMNRVAHECVATGPSSHGVPTAPDDDVGEEPEREPSLLVETREGVVGCRGSIRRGAQRTFHDHPHAEHQREHVRPFEEDVARMADHAVPDQP